MGSPVAFVNAQAMALHSGQPIVQHMCERFLFSLHKFLKIEFVIFTWIRLFFIRFSEIESVISLVSLYSVSISMFSAISRSSIKSFGRFCCRYSRSTLVRFVPNVFSKSFERDRPGGVMRVASGFFRKVFSPCCCISSAVGSFVRLFLAMKILVVSKSLKYFGGR